VICMHSKLMDFPNNDSIFTIVRRINPWSKQTYKYMSKWNEMYYYLVYAKSNVNLDEYKYTPVDCYWQLYYGITFILSLKMYILFSTHILDSEQSEEIIGFTMMFYLIFFNLLELYFTVNTFLGTIKRAKKKYHVLSS